MRDGSMMNLQIHVKRKCHHPETREYQASTVISDQYFGTSRQKTKGMFELPNEICALDNEIRGFSF